MRVATLGQIQGAVVTQRPYTLSAIAPMPSPAPGVYGIVTMTPEMQWRLGIGVGALVVGLVGGYALGSRKRR